ncbi:hypothetical protein [Ketogulonicigenium vulgare]|uniref:Uncharacterized protein n=1 Tax=Ketogulonicigenium vulgare (strain WSH-001) TaxID=759362 RepID=F9Y7S1_KETVW|nr:hypothetical protein [Ketogulonicigenium vulgare]ADO41650.1 conserved hypothetical protein [Ketogulonicigenium vulgare Y25]AEM39887.1 hypothetical protein KVU_0048 [Ketogulonicigenium vulgare WSH-001]ALJ80105.1 hypothetical protein KVH_02275 [Ketogulonicigenium vulgare]ANW32975.1 hypothetical protein KvSKV_02275 [Ketogulonicigenium vulgare]AOZ53581.1 hypothetical protein KVC_0556 [Ketogulonicigenium vulgare]
MTLIETRIVEGIWEGLLTDTVLEPRLVASHNGVDLPVAWTAQEGGDYALRVEVPRAMVSAGQHVMIIRDQDTGIEISRFVMAVGEDALNPQQAEIAILRAELDLLKSAFRSFARDAEDFQRIMVEQMEGEGGI